MEHKRIEAAHESGPGVLLGGERSSYSTTGENLNLKAALKVAYGDGPQVLRDREFGHLLGNPRIIVEPRGGSVFVAVRPKPWGWSNVDKEFLFGRGAERYALKLLERVHTEGQKEHQRRERLKAARLREREAR